MSLDGVLNEILVADTNDGPTEVKKTAWAVYALRALARATGVLAARSSFLPHVRAVVESIVAPVSDVPMAQLTGQAWQWRKRVLGLFAMCNQATMHAADALLCLRCMGGLSRSDASFLLPPGCGV